MEVKIMVEITVSFFSQSVVPVERSMCSVAERFVGTLSAAAQRHAVAYPVCAPVFRVYAYASAHPQRSAGVYRVVLYQSERRLVIFFYDFTGCVVPYHQTSGRAIVRFVLDYLLRFGRIRIEYQVPDTSVRVAKAQYFSLSYRVIRGPSYFFAPSSIGSGAAVS